MKRKFRPGKGTPAGRVPDFRSLLGTGTQRANCCGKESFSFIKSCRTWAAKWIHQRHKAPGPVHQTHNDKRRQESTTAARRPQRDAPPPQVGTRWHTRPQPLPPPPRFLREVTRLGSCSVRCASAPCAILRIIYLWMHPSWRCETLRSCAHALLCAHTKLPQDKIPGGTFRRSPPQPWGPTPPPGRPPERGGEIARQRN